MQGIYQLEYDLHRFLHLSDTESMEFRKAIWMHDTLIKDMKEEAEAINQKVSQWQTTT